jgi:hypothetical protein
LIPLHVVFSHSSCLETGHLRRRTSEKVRHRITPFTEYARTTNEKTAQLIGELNQYRKIADLMDWAKMEARFMDLFTQVGFNPLTLFNVLGGYGYWHGFMKRASDENLLKAIAAAEYYLEGLIALRGDPQQRRIAELERHATLLQALSKAVNRRQVHGCRFLALRAGKLGFDEAKDQILDGAAVLATRRDIGSGNTLKCLDRHQILCHMVTFRKNVE